MKKILRPIALFLCICVITLTILSSASNTLSRKDSVNKNADFFKQEEEFDALFFGSSHMLNAVFPMELWEEYGIVSYNFAGHGSRIPTNYWIMRNALDYAKPSVVVIDCYYLSADIKHDDVKEFVHMSLDAFPLTATKYQAINDLFETSTEKMSFLWPFSTYHNRWKELTETDFLLENSTEKGGSIRIGYTQFEKPESISEGEMFIGESQGVIYLREMVEYCKQQEIDVVLTYIPFVVAEWAQREANRVHEIANEYGVEYLDYETLSQCIDFNLDFSDGGHLNYMGGAKITSYIGKVLTEKYNITDKREAAAYHTWHEDEQAYKTFFKSLLDGQNSAMMFLPLLSDASLSSAVLYNAQSNNTGVKAMLQGLGVSEEIIQKNSSFLAFFDHEEKTCTVILGEESCETRYGTLELLTDSEGACVVLLDGVEQFAMYAGDDVSIWVNAWDDTTEETLCTTLFNKSGSR